MLAALFLLALSAPASGAASPQAADVNHCIRDDGILVYTDKPCASLRARDIGDADAARGPFTPAYRNACIGSLREFTYELSSAVEVGDVNRLAALYRWSGTSTRAGYAAMARLQDIVARPLLQVEPVYRAPPPDDLFAAGPPRSPPVALRLDQTLANGVTPAPTTLRLERDLGCWWVSL